MNGEIIDVREVEEARNNFEKAVLNRLEFRNLDGGTYALVKIEESYEGVEADDEGNLVGVEFETLMKGGSGI